MRRATQLTPQKRWDGGKRRPAAGIGTEGWLRPPCSSNDEEPGKSAFSGVQSQKKISLKLQKRPVLGRLVEVMDLTQTSVGSGLAGPQQHDPPTPAFGGCDVLSLLHPRCLGLSSISPRNSFFLWL